MLVSSLDIFYWALQHFTFSNATDNCICKTKSRFIDVLLYNDIVVFAIHFLNNNQLLHCIGFYSRVFVLFLFWRGASRVKIKIKQIRVNKIQYRAITVLLYTCVTHHDKKKKTHYLLIFMANWQNGKIFQAKGRLFHLI